MVLNGVLNNVRYLCIQTSSFPCALYLSVFVESALLACSRTLLISLFVLSEWCRTSGKDKLQSLMTTGRVNKEKTEPYQRTLKERI